MHKAVARMKSEQGFTLIELLIVIVVLGILAGIVLFAVGSTRDDATTAKNNSNAKICATAKAASKAKYGTEAAWTEYIDGGTGC